MDAGWLFIGLPALLFRREKEKIWPRINPKQATREPANEEEEHEWIVNWIKLICQDAYDELDVPITEEIQISDPDPIYKNPCSYFNKRSYKPRKDVVPCGSGYNYYYNKSWYYSDTHYKLLLALEYLNCCKRNEWPLDCEVKSLMNTYDDLLENGNGFER